MGTLVCTKKDPINILDSFDPGDEILIRFRLSPDPGVQAWGWVIDDLVIQKAPLKIKKDEEVDWEIYPNPITDIIKINLKFKKHGIIKILDLQNQNDTNPTSDSKLTKLYLKEVILQSVFDLLEVQGFHQIKKVVVPLMNYHAQILF